MTHDIIERLRALQGNTADEAAELILRLTSERDETRRGYCEWMASGAVIVDERPTAAELARRMGWDCYEKEASK